MTTRQEVMTAKDEYYDHIRHHPGCEAGCTDRAEARVNWMKAAGEWEAESESARGRLGRHHHGGREIRP